MKMWPLLCTTAQRAIFLSQCGRARPITITPIAEFRRLPRREYVTVFGYTQAKALVFSEHGQPKDILRLHKYSISPASGATINLKLLASPINPADINQLEGVYPSKPPFTTHLGTPTPTAIPGNEGVCEVISVGNEVTNFSLGDRAIFRGTCFGTWRTHAVVNEQDNQLIKIPKDIPVLSAATVSVNPCTAYRMLSDFWLSPDELDGDGRGSSGLSGLQAAAVSGNEWVIQNGANSGVGRAVIQIAKIWNLKTINVIRKGNKTPEEITALIEELKSLGANEVILDEELTSSPSSSKDKKTGPGSGGDIKSKINTLTNGHGIGLALNCVGGKPATELARLLRKKGTLVTYGAMARQPLTIPASLFIFKDLRMRGFWVSEWAKGKDVEKEKMLNEIFEWMKKGWLRDVPVREIKWSEEVKEEELVGEVVKAAEGSGPKNVFVFDEN